MLVWRVLLAVLLACATGSAARRPDAWEVIGPGGGGAMFFPTVSPVDPTLVLVGCDMTGSYLSEDGGDTWSQFDLHGRARFFVFDPVDPRTIYVQSIGLWRSTGDDHASETLLVGGRPAPMVTALGIDPADNRHLWAAIRQNEGAGLYLSVNRGGAWQRAAALGAGARQIYIDPASPQTSRTVYIAGAGPVAVWQAGHLRTGGMPPGVSAFTEVSASFPPGGGPLVIYGITNSAAYVSPDGGATWQALELPGEAPRLRTVATSLHAPNVAYLSYTGLRVSNTRYFGVARTADRGRTWNLVWKESRTAAPNIHDAWITERFGPGWGENPLGLGVAPDNPDLCFATDLGRTLRTNDGGKTWAAVYSKRVPGGYTTTGLNVTTNYGVHFDPFDPHRMFITYTDIGLFRSEDGGQSWVSSTAGVPREWVNTTYWLAFDPEVRGRVWGVMSKTHDLPRPKMWRRAPLSSFGGGVCRSDDGGRTWRVSNNGMAPTAATHILLDPRSPAGARVLYVAAFGRGVYKSTDGGNTWTLKHRGIAGTAPLAWRLAQDPAGTLYLVVARRSEDGRIGDLEDGALYRSADAAESWERLPLPSGVNGPNGLTIDPQDARRLYLAAWARNGPGHGTGGGIFLSEDSGLTWRSVLAADQHIYDVTADPRAPGTLYACGFESSAWRSTDRGQTWQRLRGYTFKWGHRVIPDPLDPLRVYITTFGGSVWRGPAAGDPNAMEDPAPYAFSK